MATVAKVLFGLALGLQWGCGTFINRPIVYEDSRETAPLEVPRDLMRPAVNPALQIPAVAGLASNADVSPPLLGNTVAAARGGLPRAANAVLTIADEADSTWRRVGIALQRSGCCKVLEQDESAMVYQVELISDAPKPGFFGRMFGSSPSTTMQVKVDAVGSGSNVTIVDDDGKVRVDDPAMTVLGVVEARLR